MDAIRPFVTFLIPSHREGNLLRLTGETILAELKKENIDDFEIIVSDCNHENDGGTEAGEALTKLDSRVRYVRQDGCFNLGAHYSFGLNKAKGEYFMMVPGDNEIMGEAIHNVLKARGQAELIITYTENQEVRPQIRRFISRAYVGICNALFGLNLKYYTGLSLIKTNLLKSLLPLSEGFAYSTEIVVRLIRGGHSYKEVPMRIYPPVPGRKAAAFRLKNIVSVGKTLVHLVWQERLKK